MSLSISETLRTMEQLDALLGRIEELDREFEDTFVRLINWTVESDEGSAQIEIEIAGDFGSYPRERWRVLATSVLEWHCHALWPAGFGAHDPLIHATDHPLLWTSSGERGDLYFRGRHENPAVVAAELNERHHDETGGWLSISRFANIEFTGRLRALLASEYGLLASGPPRLLEAYADVLGSAGFQTSLLRSRGGLPSPAPAQPLGVITLGEPSYRGDGHAYIVAAEFGSERVG
jgi:hypothetical protein